MRIIFISFLLLFLLACESNTEPTTLETEHKVETAEPEMSTQVMLCFGQREPAYMEDEPMGGYNYAITVFDVSDPERVEGYYRYHPFGTDSGVGHLKGGTYDAEKGIIIGQTMNYAEGSAFEQQEIWKVEDGLLIGGYTEAQLNEQPEDFADLSKVQWADAEYGMPKVECEQINVLMRQFNQDMEQFAEPVNTERLNNALQPEKPFAAADVTERYVDLDADYQTEEYLYYIASDQLLVVLNKKGEITHQYQNVELPILTGQREEDQVWKDIVFKVNGQFRLLSNQGDGYPEDPANASTLSEREVMWHPEVFYTIIAN